MSKSKAAKLSKSTDIPRSVYELIVRRFLAIFYPPAVYQKITVDTALGTEHFISGYKTLLDEGYLSVMKYSFADAGKDKKDRTGSNCCPGSE